MIEAANRALFLHRLICRSRARNQNRLAFVIAAFAEDVDLRHLLLIEKFVDGFDV